MPLPGTLLYLDSSAIVKLVFAEPQSMALRELLRSWPERVSSVIAAVEVSRAARRVGASAARRAEEVVTRLGLIDLDDDVIQRASKLRPPELRTLDAIHLATALSLG
ncbi:MAG TPA: type II toxin-antitoxin system VapC family toxin, partial [Actinomycetota bacterium]|nr:type II toxin-antitoxin system VapC family toxin [Actinomycetota bacterium]